MSDGKASPTLSSAIFAVSSTALFVFEEGS
jgi:hypothetical protein